MPDMRYIRREIPIADVARELGIRVSGRNAAHCWRDGHQNGDRTPSMSFRRNRARCHVCDADSMSVIDLVIKFQELDPSRGLKQATEWLCARWPVPTIAKSAKLSRPERWAASPVGISSFPLERFVRSGVWAALDDAGRAVLPALFCFTEKNEVCVSYRALARYAGKASDATIAKALQRLKQLGILEALPKMGNNFRDAGRYRFTLDSPKFQAAISEIHARLKLESGAERELRAQARAVPLPNPESANRKALYPGTSTLFSSCSVSKVHTSPRCSVKQETHAAPNEENEPFFEDAGIDNKETCESAHYTLVKCEDEKQPNKIITNIPRASENAEEQSPISGSAHAENKTACTSAHFSTVKCEESAPAPICVTKVVENSSPRIEQKSTDFNFGWNVVQAAND